MPTGPGKYDDECSVARLQTGARGVILIVLGGDRGNGFAVQAEENITADLPKLLRSVADEIERSTR